MDADQQAQLLKDAEKALKAWLLENYPRHDILESDLSYGGSIPEGMIAVEVRHGRRLGGDALTDVETHKLTYAKGELIPIIREERPRSRKRLGM